jgi:hypothetical protein
MSSTVAEHIDEDDQVFVLAAAAIKNKRKDRA